MAVFNIDLRRNTNFNVLLVPAIFSVCISGVEYAAVAVNVYNGSTELPMVSLEVVP